MAPTFSPRLDLEETPTLKASVNRSASSPTLSQTSRSPPVSSGEESPLSRNEVASEGSDSVELTESDLLDSQNWMTPARPQLLSFEGTLMHSNLTQLAKTVDKIYKVVLWLQRDAKYNMTDRGPSKLEEMDSVEVTEGDLLNSQDWLAPARPQLLSFEGTLMHSNLTQLAKTVDKIYKVVLWLQRHARKFDTTTASETTSATLAESNPVAEVLEDPEFDGLLADQFSIFYASLGDKGKFSTRKGKNSLKHAQDFKGQLVAGFSADDGHPVVDFVSALDGDALQQVFLKQPKSADTKALSRKRTHSSERTGDESPMKKKQGRGPIVIDSDDDFEAEAADDGAGDE